MSTQTISDSTHQTFAQAAHLLERMADYPAYQDTHQMHTWYQGQAQLFAQVGAAAADYLELDPTHQKGIREQYPDCKQLVNTWQFLVAAEPADPGPIL